MNDVFTWPVGRAPSTCNGLQQNRPPPARPVIAYVVAATLGGGLTGLGLSALGAGARTLGFPLDALLAACGGLLVMAAAYLELLERIAPLPERAAQVPRRWLSWRSKVRTAFVFGVMIGGGVTVRLQHVAAYILAILCFFSPSVLAGVALGALYGLVRGLVLLTTWLMDVREMGRPQWESLADRRVSRALAIGGIVTVLATVLLDPGGAWAEIGINFDLLNTN
jgi:hypothetical protein